MLAHVSGGDADAGTTQATSAEVSAQNCV
jgi:hypothetical protein